MTVTNAKFRLATSEEVQDKQGDCLSRALSTPWKLFNKIWGTFNMYQGGANVLAWDTPLPLKIAHWFTWNLGMAPHHAFIKEIPSLLFNSVAITEEKTSAAFLALHRNGNDQLLTLNRSMNKLYEMIKQTFSDMEISREDVIFTCGEENSKLYRKMFSVLMHGNQMNDAIHEEVEEALSRWTIECRGGNFINITTQTRRLASNIITRVLFGQKVNSMNLCDAVNYINEFTIKDLTRAATSKDREKYAETLSVFKEETENILNSGVKIPLLGDNELTPAQERALVFVAFFAGQETVASLLANTLFEIGRNPLQAERLAKDSLDDFFVRSIHDFTPAYSVGRQLKSPLCLEYTLEGELLPRKVIFLKDSYLSARMTAVAEATLLPQEGELPHNLPWLPFGSGPHACPGRALAKKEFEALFDALKHGYEIKLHPQQKEPKRLALITLQLTEDIYINIERKQNM